MHGGHLPQRSFFRRGHFAVEIIFLWRMEPDSLQTLMRYSIFSTSQLELYCCLSSHAPTGLEKTSKGE
jgi:hypothetical protein